MIPVADHSALRRWRKALLTLLMTAFCVSATGLQAQERLLLLHENGTLAEIETSDVVLGTTRVLAKIPPQMLDDTVAFPLAGARYLLLRRVTVNGTTMLAVFDTRTSAVLAQWTLPGAAVVETDDFRPRVFYRTTTTVGVIEAPTFVPRVLRDTPDVELSESALARTPLAYAHATDTVLVLTRAPSLFPIPPSAALGPPTVLLAIDATAGAIRATGYLDESWPAAFIVDEAGSRLFVPRADATVNLRTFNLATLAFIGATLDYEGSDGIQWSFDRLRRQILGSTKVASGFALNADLSLAAVVDFRYLPSVFALPPSRLAASTVRARTFAALGRADYFDLFGRVPGRLFLVAMDATTLQPVATIDLLQRGLVAGRAQLILLNPPTPPTPLVGTVNGRDVHLAWQDPGDTTHFLVEAGTLPGRSNVGIFHVGAARQFDAQAVPPGRYYVRVLAANDVGISLPSNEVVIVVEPSGFQGSRVPGFQGSRVPKVQVPWFTSQVR